MSHYEGTGEVTLCLRDPGNGAQASKELAPEPQEVRDERNRRRTAQRRRTEIRRYCVRNKLSRMWTFTWAEPQLDRSEALAQWAAFLVRFYARYGKMAWLRVFEVHKGGMCEYCDVEHEVGRLHVHAAFPKKFLAHGEMERLWGHGWVHFADRQSGASGRHRARTLAQYVAKYVAKECEAGNGEHGYEVAQGYQVRCAKSVAPSLFYARLKLARMGLGYLQHEFASDDWKDWRGPPIKVFWFNDEIRSYGSGQAQAA